MNDFYLPGGGHDIIRYNNVECCGFGGIEGSHLENTVVEYNTIHDCCWHETELYFENGGIKFLHNKNVLVRGNHIYNIKNANAIWLDWACENCRVTGNVTHNIKSMFGSIFMEASRIPNIVDNNIIWNVQGNGIYQHDCDNLIIAHNFIGKCTGFAVKMWCNKERFVLGAFSESKDNMVYGNLFFKTSGTVFSPNMHNKS